MKPASQALSAIVIAVALLLSGQAANAQQLCTPREKAVAQLEKQFEEMVSGRGLAVNGKRMIELFVSEKGSWTILMSDPTGRSCAIASGGHWQGISVLVGDPA